jgi:phage tail sheath protein FI
VPVAPTYPGVYIEEIPSGVRPIRAVATSIAAFIDFFAEGPMDEPVRIQGMGDFTRRFGGLDARSAASYAIAQFFLNGGSEAHVVRVAATAGANAPRRAQVLVEAPDGTTVMQVLAASQGVWGNNLRVTIDWVVDADSDPTSFNLSVARYSPDNPGAVVAAEGPFLNLSTDPNDTRYFPTVVNDASELIEVVHGDGVNPPPGAGVFPAVSGTLGGALPDDLTTIADGQFRLDVLDAGGTSLTGVHRATYTAPTAPAGGQVTLQMVRRAVEQAVRQAVPIDAGTGNPNGDPTHALISSASVSLLNRRLLLRAGRRAPEYDPVARVVVAEHDGGTTAADLLLAGGAGEFVSTQEYELGSADSVGGQSGGADFSGRDGVAPDASALRGDPATHTGLYALEDVDLFNVLCLPRAAALPDAEMRAVVEEAIRYCEDRRAFLIIDVPEAINTVEEAEAWIDDHATFRHRNAALYFPRVIVPDPENDYRDRSIGASGTMAGVYARTDTARGVWKAPAGVEATLRGLSRLDANLTDGQNGTLNPIAVNCLRTFPIYGAVSWGARTLVGADAMASEWKYVPVRRLALMIEETLFRGTKWVVFEPNDEPLWAKIRQNVGAFMMSLFRQGAFQGDTPGKAFYVKCDGETTTANDRNLGIVNIEVGFAPLKPAEFVVIKIQQIPDVD